MIKVPIWKGVEDIRGRMIMILSGEREVSEKEYEEIWKKAKKNDIKNKKIEAEGEKRT